MQCILSKETVAGRAGWWYAFPALEFHQRKTREVHAVVIPDDFTRRLRVSRWGALLALLTILFGFGIGGAFGAFEDQMKQGLADRAAAVLDSAYKGDTAKAKSVVDKSWAYYKRAHLHGGAIGAVALGSILLLAALRRPNDHVRRGVSVALGAGGLGYSVFW